MAENGPWLDSVTSRFETMDNDFRSYFHWFEKTIGLHLVSRNLVDYAMLYSDQINRFKRINLYDLTMPRLNSELQHGGPNLPPVRSIFGRGANFMLRELARMGHITNPIAFPHCYVGFRRVRHLLSDYLGFPDIENQPNQSTLIHQFLVEHLGEDKTHFESCFDIPLEIISEDPELIQQFFGEDRLSTVDDDEQEDM
jgi:hypothetical protein